MKTVIAIDLETTGFNTKKDAILEIGVVKLSAGKIEKWSTLITPPKIIPADVSKLTGLTLKDFTEENTMPLEQALKHFRTVLVPSHNYLIVAHNISFETRFLNHFLASYGLPKLREKYTDCSLKSFKRKYPKAKAKLNDACKKCNIPTSNVNHRALEDAFKCFKLYMKLNYSNYRIPI